MRFSNDSSTWSAWETYGTSKNWILKPGEAGKTVYVQFRDAAGHVSYTSSDQIIFVTSNFATLAFVWEGEGEAQLRLTNAQGVTINSRTVQGYGSDLSWYVNVPAGQVYYMTCDYWWSAGGCGGYYGGGTGVYTNNTAINPDGILSPGETVTWYYP